VSPLNAMSMAATERFAVSDTYLHIGTDEALVATYTVYDKTSSATAVMTDYQNGYGTSPTTPKVGDQVLYYAMFQAGAAPHVAITFVRVGQVILTLAWFRIDRGVTVQMLAKNAKKFADPLKNLGKTKPRSRAADPNQLPPSGVSVTLLGSAMLPVEAFVGMVGISIPEQFLALMKNSGINNFAYGDYALNNDTSMEVQTALLKFPSETDATDFADTFAPDKPDAQGIAFAYIPVGNTPAAGVYHFLMTYGSYVGFLICRSTTLGAAASRECEDPVHTVALAWKLALSGLR
jgi:hypothetical protein